MKLPLTVNAMSNVVLLQEADGTVVATFSSMKAALADEVARIVNAHGAMVEALEQAKVELDEDYAIYGFTSAGRVAKRAEAALALAKEGKCQK